MSSPNSIVKIPKKVEGGFSIVHGDHIVNVGGRAREGMYFLYFTLMIFQREEVGCVEGEFGSGEIPQTYDQLSHTDL